MMAVTLLLDKGVRHWPDLERKRAEGKLIDVSDDPNAVLTFAEIKRGTQSGNQSVLFRIDLPDGRVIISQTSFALLKQITDAIAVSPDYATNGSENIQ